MYIPKAVHEGSGFPISSPTLVIWGECDASCLCVTRHLIVTLIVFYDCDVQARLHGLGDLGVSGEVSVQDCAHFLSTYSCCVHVCSCAHTCRNIHVEVRGQPSAMWVSETLVVRLSSKCPPC